MPSALVSSVFWQHTGETALGYAASGVSTVLLLHAGQLLSDVPWYTALSGGVIGAVIGVCKSFHSLLVQPGNGTASYLRRVVAGPS